MLASVAGVGDGAVAVGETLPCELFREALEALDPEAVLLLDNNAADAMRETYADMLVAIVTSTPPCSSPPGRPCAGPPRARARRF